ncbi:MAG: hypothetical protein HFJ29_04300 [Clostridia bacterium]|nr:hypothetical protein [Clostridia bacterium]
MNNKKYLKGVTIRDLAESDRERCEGLGFEFMLEGGYKVLEYKSLFVVISKCDYESYGKGRIKNVVYIEHSKIFNEDFLRVDFENIVNDEKFNIPKTIEVEFIKNIKGTSDSIFRAINNPKRYYMRQDTQREKFAKWFSAYKINGEWSDNNIIRANITFKMGEQLEKVSFANWNAEGVYSKDYNEAFSYNNLQKHEEKDNSKIEDYEIEDEI